MEITTEQVKELRDETGVSVMQCKQALDEARGDLEKARAILREKGVAAVAKKSDRELGAGVVSAYIHNGGEVGAMILLSCETDFVAKNEEFVALARDIAMHAAAMNPHIVSPDENLAVPKERVLLEQAFIKDPEVTIRGLIEQAVQKFGERIEVSRYVRFSTRD